MSKIARVLCAICIASATAFTTPARTEIAAEKTSSEVVSLQANNNAGEGIKITDFEPRTLCAVDETHIFEEKISTLPYGQVIEDCSRLRREPSYESEVMFLFREGMTFEIIERQSDWLKVKYNDLEGFIDVSLVEQYQENPPHEVYIEPVYVESSYEEVYYGEPHYNPNNLRELSNLSEAQIYQMLEGSALQSLSRAYYYAEKEYNVNAIFLMALNSEESGHGRSYLAMSHNNLGGVKGMDGNWAYFSDWGESLSYIANLIDTMYLTEGAAYHNGTSIWAVNVRYCEEDTWAGNINEIVNDLMRKL